MVACAVAKAPTGGDPKRSRVSLQTAAEVHEHRESSNSCVAFIENGEPEEFAKLASKQYQRWNALRRLLEALSKIDNDTIANQKDKDKPNKGRDQVESLAVILDDFVDSQDQDAKDFLETGRDLIGKICESVLPKEDLDIRVIISNAGEAVPRDDVTVSLKGKREVKLKDRKDNEFTIDDAQIDQVFYNGGNRQRPNIAPWLKPTKYTEAIRAYNSALSKFSKWNLKDLLELSASIQGEHATALKAETNLTGSNLPDRIEKLLEVFKKHKKLLANEAASG